MVDAHAPRLQRAAAMRAARRRRDLGLATCAARSRPRRPVISVTAFSVPPMMPVPARHVVGHDPVAALARALGGGVGDHVVGLGGEAHDERAGGPSPAARRWRGCRGSRRTRARAARPSPSFLILPARRALHPPVGHGGGEDGGVGGQRRLTAASISARSRPARPSTPGGGGTSAGPVTKVTRAPSAASAAAMAVPCAPDERLAM